MADHPKPNRVLPWCRFVLSHVLNHPMNHGRPLRTVGRVVGWQVWKRITGRPLLVHFVNGTRLRIHPKHMSSALVLYTRLPDRDEMAFLLHYLRPQDFVIDVGANVGVYTILAASCVRGGSVQAFEPDALARDELKANLALNDLRNVDVRPEAVAERVGDTWFTEGLDDCNHIIAATQAVRGRIVPTITLDAACGDGVLPTVVKMDAEGEGVAILRGATSLLDGPYPPLWIAEVDGLNDVQDLGKLHLNPVVQSFRERRFDAYRYDSETHRLCPPLLPPRSNNLLFIRDDRVEEVQQRVALAHSSKSESGP